MTTTYRGHTILQAHNAAKAGLGHNAIFLKQRRVRKRGVAGLLGATEFEIEAESAPELPELEPENEWDPIPAAASHPFSRDAYDCNELAISSGSDVVVLRRELRSVQAALHRLAKGTGPWRKEISELRRAIKESRPVETGPARVRRLLAQSGIDGKTARCLIRAIGKHDGNDDSLMDAYRDALADRIRVSPWPLACDGQKVIAVVGPPGVGKTTTAAKLAARAIADHQKKVTLVAGDSYRVAAIEQLGRFASLMGAELEVASCADELHQIIRKSTSDLVIVDTAGRPPDSIDCVEAALGTQRLESERKTGWEHRSRHVLLCLPAALRATDAESIVDRYALSSPTAIAITKIDLTTGPGGLIVGSAHADVPISTLCMGQNVPEDIAPATTGAIVEHLAPRNYNESS